MKKYFKFCLLFGAIFLLCGCNNTKILNTENKNVYGLVTYVKYTPGYSQPIICGKITTIITHPASYKVIIEYDGTKYELDDSDSYNKCKSKVNQYVDCTLSIKNYSDGTTKREIIEVN